MTTTIDAEAMSAVLADTAPSKNTYAYSYKKYLSFSARWVLLSYIRFYLCGGTDGADKVSAGGNCAVQYAQRVALSCTVLRQKGHSRVVGASSFFGRKRL